MRMIDADELKASIPETNVSIFENCHDCTLLDAEQVKELIDDAPTIEALKEQPQIVRCKVCTHRRDADNWCGVIAKNVENLDWFCADARRKDDDSNDDG